MYNSQSAYVDLSEERVDEQSISAVNLLNLNY